MQRKSSALLALLLAGCATHVKPPAPPPFDGAAVRVWCPADVAELFRSQSAVWRARQNAIVEVVADPGRADVWALPPADVGRLADGVPVPESLVKRGEGFDWTGLLSLYREQLGQADGKNVAVPLAGESLVCVYRAELYAAPPGAKYAEWRKGQGLPPLPLRPPLTWQEFRDQAAFFAAETGKKSLPPLPASVEGLDRLFYTVAAPHARRAIREGDEERTDDLAEQFYFHYAVKTQTPRIASEGFVHALKLMHDLKRVASDDPESLFKGEAALAIVEAGALARLQRDPTTRDRYGVCGVPGSDRFWDNAGLPHQGGPVNVVPYLGGAGLMAGVPKTAANADAAWDLLADLAGPKRSAEVAMEPRWGGGPVRGEQAQRDRWDSFGLDGIRSQALRDAVGRNVLQRETRNPALVLRTDDHEARRAALNRALLAALGGKDAQKALDDAQAEWEALDAKKGKGRAWADYRRSLGLLH